MREGVGNFGRRTDTRGKREKPSKMGKLSTTNLESSWEAHIQGNRIPIGLETLSLGPLGWFLEVFPS